MQPLVFDFKDAFKAKESNNDSIKKLHFSTAKTYISRFSDKSNSYNQAYQFVHLNTYWTS